jgi:hypothetical protein
MKTYHSDQTGRTCGLAHWLPALALTLSIALPILARADDNLEFFDALTNAADTNNWIQVIDYSDEQGGFSISNGGYRMQAESLGGTDIAVIDAYPAGLVYTNCQVSLDVINWNRYPWPSNLAAINIFARANNFNNASTGYGYLFYFQPNGDTTIPYDGKAEAGIFRIDPGSSVTFNQGSEFPININDPYRLVFTVNGTSLTGQIFDLTNLVNPVFTFQTTDNKYTSGGSVGIFANDDAAVEGYGNKPVDFTVNNFRAGPVTPLLNIQQTVSLSWPDSYAGYTLQTATNLSGPWQPLGVTAQDSAGIYTATVNAAYSSQFFRLLSQP